MDPNLPPPIPRRRRRNGKLWLFLGVLLVAAGYAGWRWRFSKRAPEVRYETATVDRGRIAARVTATGTLSALVTVQVGSQVSGRLQKIFVDFNSHVDRGQIIAKIDPPLFEAALEQARANLVAAEGDMTRARVQAADGQRQLARAKGLADRQMIAAADLDAAQATADGARAGVAAAEGKVAQARAALRQAQVNLEYTNIVSPISGSVISRNVDVGQTVAASLQAPTLFMIAEDLAKMQVDTSVAEADIGKLQPEMAAEFVVDAFPGERFAGKVRQIRNAPQTVQNVVTYDAVIDVENRDLKLRPGMTANVTFVHAQKDDVLRVPNAALRFRPPPEMWRHGGPQGAPAVGEARAETPRRGRPPEAADRRAVWVLRPGAALPEPVRVKTGISDGSLTEMVEGDLKEGDVLVTDMSGGGAGQRPPGGGMPGGPPGGGAFRRVF